jgi:hypothetical protein
MSGLVYLIIGDFNNKQIIGSYKTKTTPYEVIEKSQTIFNNSKSFEKRGKSSHGTYIYISSLIRSNIFLLAVIPFEQDERKAYNLFEDIENQGIWRNVDSQTGELNNVGKQNLQILVEKYLENSIGKDKLTRVNSEISEIQVEVKDGIKKMINNSEIVRSLDLKADRIKDSSLLFKRDSVNLNNAIWWRNMRTKIFFICLFVAIFGYILYLIFF